MNTRFHRDGTTPAPAEDWVWVFGSNLAGIHGAGAALVAKKQFGAQYGKFKGMTGNAYAIPTKDQYLCTLPLEVVKSHIQDFKFYAKSNPDKRFWVTAVGCGLAGFHAHEIAPLFADCGDNCSLPDSWLKQLG